VPAGADAKVAERVADRKPAEAATPDAETAPAAAEPAAEMKPQDVAAEAKPAAEATPGPAAEPEPAAPAAAERDKSIGQPQTEAPKDGTPSGEPPLRQDVPPESSAPGANKAAADDEGTNDDKRTGEASASPDKPPAWVQRSAPPMSEKRTEITPHLEEVLAPYWDEVDPLVVAIQDDLHRREKVPMQISREQVRFNAWLCRLIGAKTVLEVGTYMGLSAVAFAQALPPDGHVDTVEISDEHADIAEGWFREGGLTERITVHRGAALDVVPRLHGLYDVCFIDAAKRDNLQLLRLCIDRTRSGGLILIDNAFRSGALGTSADADDVGTMGALEFARSSDQLDSVVLPIADGVLACRRV
jgi:predicted O-methyltransferase YrrM